MEQLKTCYETALREDGGEITAFRYGLDYSKALHRSGYRIQAQRLTTKILHICQRVHGPEHSVTERASLYNKIERYRGMFNGENYAFVKYNSANNNYVVRGPLDAGRAFYEETTGKRSVVSIASGTSGFVIPNTPVYICGLAAPQEHFNGKIGQVSIHGGKIKCAQGWQFQASGKLQHSL